MRSCFFLPLVALLSSCGEAPVDDGSLIAGPSPRAPAVEDAPTAAPAPVVPVPPPATTPPSDPVPPAPPAPPPSVTFAGGTLGALRALSPSLTFDALTITGTLALYPSDLATLHARTFTLAASGRVEAHFERCTYDAPSLTVTATGPVSLAGAVVLRGRDGERVFSTDPCRSSSGGRGGSLTLVGETVEVAGLVNLAGGVSEQSAMMLPGGDHVWMGATGGDGGDATFSAERSVEVRTRVVTSGGAGSYGQLASGQVMDQPVSGAAGELSWDAPEVRAAEVEENGTRNTATPLPLGPLTVRGEIGSNDDADSASCSDAMFLTFGGSTPNDRLEDLFRVVSTETHSRSVTVELSSSAAGVDLDLAVTNANGTALLGTSLTPGAAERVTFNAQPGQTYFVGVSVVGRGGATYEVTLR